MLMKVDDLELLKKKGIYSITNVLNNKKYIGSTAKSFKSRLTQHLSKLRLQKHHCIHLQYAWTKLRAPKSRKLSCANGMNSWKAEKPIMSQVESTLSEGAETTGEV